MHYSTRRQCLSPLVRLDNRLLNGYGPTSLQTRTDIFWDSLIRCIFPLDNLLCRPDNACVHSYDWTTDWYAPVLPHKRYFLRLDPLWDVFFHSTISFVDPTMLVSTRTTRQLIARPYCLTNTDWYFLSLPNERHFSTRQFTLSTRQYLCPLVRPVRLDNWLQGPYCLTNTDWYFLSLPNEMHFSTSTPSI